MSRDLTLAHPQSALPAAVPTVPMSRRLASAVEAIEKPHPDIPMPDAYPAALIAEAKAALESLRAHCAPVTAEQLAAWLMPITPGLPNPLAKEAVKPWLAAVMIAVGDMEACLFNAETQRSALREWRFWPSAADVYGLLVGPQMTLRDRLFALGMISRSEAAP